jgi:hypothetical protein
MEGWVKYKGFDISGIDLTVEHHTACPQCVESGNDKSQDNLFVYGVDDEGKIGGFRCFACGYSMTSEQWREENNVNFKLENKGLTIAQKDVNKFNEKKLTDEQIDEILNKTSGELTVKYRGLNPDVCKELGIRWTYDQNGKVSEMWFPSNYYVDGKLKPSGYKVRKVPKDFYSVGYVGKLNLLGGQTNQVADTLVVVAGEVDLLTAISSLESVKKYNKTVNVVTSLIGEDSTAESLRHHFEWVDKHNKIIVCMDNDDAGNKAFEKVKQVISNDKLFKANLKYNDLNDYLKNKEGDLIVKDLYWNAVPLETYGVVGSGQLLAKARERLNQDKIPFPAFLSDLAENFTDKAMWTGEWMNWISSVSSGKSTVMDAWMIDWALNAPYRQAIMSYEADGTAFGVKVASLATSRSIMKIEGKENRINFLDENEEKVNHLLLNEDGEDRFDFVDTLPESVEAAKKLINYLVRVRNVRILWIDPCVDFLSICKNKNEYDDLIMFLDQTRMKYHVTIMTAMHTRKNLSSGQNGSSGGEINEEDAYGGREVIAKGTINITAQRNKNAEDWVEKNTMRLNIRKNRNDQVTGVETKLFYRSKANKLYPFSYAEANKFFIDDFNKSVEEINVEDDLGFSLNHVGVSDIEQVVMDDEDDVKLNW